MPVSEPLTASLRGRSDRVQSLLETIRVRTLGLGQRLEPVGDLGESFFARLLRHARIHVAVFVRLAGDGGLQVHPGLADGQTRRRITDRLEILEMSVRMTRLTLGRRTEHSGNVVVAFDIGLGCEIQVTAIRLGFTGECVLQVLFGIAAFEVHGITPYSFSVERESLSFRLVLRVARTLRPATRGRQSSPSIVCPASQRPVTSRA